MWAAASRASLDARMKNPQGIGIGLGAVVLLFVAIGFCLPRKFHVERTLEIKRRPKPFYAVIIKLRSADMGLRGRKQAQRT